MKVKVKTDGDMYASLSHERVLVEFEKDGDSPRCPESWTYSVWFDGDLIDSNVYEASLATNVKEAMSNISGIIKELTTIRDYLIAYGAFAKEPEVTE